MMALHGGRFITSRTSVVLSCCGSISWPPEVGAFACYLCLLGRSCSEAASTAKGGDLLKLCARVQRGGLLEFPMYLTYFNYSAGSIAKVSTFPSRWQRTLPMRPSLSHGGHSGEILDLGIKNG